MKKMIITVNGKKYDVEVEMYDEDDFLTPSPQTFYNPALYKDENFGIQNSSSDLIIARPSKIVPTIKNSQNSPVNGKVMEIYVKEGDKVNERDKIMALEAMKMKTNIYAIKTGKIASINVKIGDTVEQNQLLVTYE